VIVSGPDYRNPHFKPSPMNVHHHHNQNRILVLKPVIASRTSTTIFFHFVSIPLNVRYYHPKELHLITQALCSSHFQSSKPSEDTQCPAEFTLYKLNAPKLRRASLKNGIETRIRRESTLHLCFCRNFICAKVFNICRKQFRTHNLLLLRANMTD
jgi:hypothetical protein